VLMKIRILWNMIQDQKVHSYQSSGDTNLLWNVRKYACSTNIIAHTIKKPKIYTFVFLFPTTCFGDKY